MNIWLPNNASYDAYRVDRAVNQYDKRLMFGRNEDTGDWCVFIRMPRPREPFPVMGFGNSVPDINIVMDRIREADTMRTGNQIYEEIVRSQKKYREELDYAASQAGEESAEVIEHFMRKRGKSPAIKSLSKEVSSNDA